ncbi:natriuretic peptides A [Centropristis striata]|uniref:natriuretic peptides A n=1 Tax=Centropristis striata TaxID=184440 RepID=UPI0027E039CD|nr:natriuretic peptides A [Centropristis striata]
MRTAVLWGLLALLFHHTMVSSHILGRPSSTSDLAQLKSLLERFEETLAEAAQAEDSEADYEKINQQPESSQDSQGWNLGQEGDQEPLTAERSPLAADGRSRTVSQRSRLQDLLLTARKRASSCFGARMDRIGNASGLGCNNGKG